MSKNYLKCKGKRYKAVDAIKKGSCTGCDLNYFSEGCMEVSCNLSYREDGRDVIWRKQPSFTIRDSEMQKTQRMLLRRGE